MIFNSFTMPIISIIKNHSHMPALHSNKNLHWRSQQKSIMKTRFPSILGNFNNSWEARKIYIKYLLLRVRTLYLGRYWGDILSHALYRIIILTTIWWMHNRIYERYDEWEEALFLKQRHQDDQSSITSRTYS